jgi:hypothetical protein
MLGDIMMYRTLLVVCAMHFVSAQDIFHGVDDNIAMETFSGKNLDFSKYGFENGPNRFSTFLSRAGELFSDSDFGKKIKHDGTKPQVIHAVNIKEVSKKDETDFRTQQINKRQKHDQSLGNLTRLVKIDKFTGKFNETTTRMRYYLYCTVLYCTVLYCKHCRLHSPCLMTIG